MPREGIEPSCIVMELYYLKTKNKRFKGYLADNPSAYGEDHLSSVHEGVDTELMLNALNFILFLLSGNCTQDINQDQRED